MNIELDVTPLVWHKCIENKRYRKAAEEAMNHYVAKADITQSDGWDDPYFLSEFPFNSVHFVRDGRIQITLYEW